MCLRDGHWLMLASIDDSFCVFFVWFLVAELFSWTITESRSPTARALRSANGDTDASVHRESADTVPEHTRRLADNDNHRFIDDLSFEFHRLEGTA